jgi:hypothetical protein
MRHGQLQGQRPKLKGRSEKVPSHFPFQPIPDLDTNLFIFPSNAMSKTVQCRFQLHALFPALLGALLSLPSLLLFRLALRLKILSMPTSENS